MAHSESSEAWRAIAITSRSDARAALKAIQMLCWHKLEHVGYPILVRGQLAPSPTCPFSMAGALFWLTESHSIAITLA